MAQRHDIANVPAAGAASAGCFSCSAKDESEWAALSQDELAVLNASRVCNTYRAGRAIFYQGNSCLGVYCISNGMVALRKTDEQGHSAILRLVHGGQTLGYRSFFADTEYTATAEAVTDCRVCFVDREALRRLLDANSAVMEKFLQRATRELGEADEARLQLNTLPVRARIARLLLDLREQCGEVDDEGVLTVHLPLSRQDIAALVAARPETIARSIAALEKDGVAHFDRRTVRIVDLDMLLDEVEEPSGARGH